MIAARGCVLVCLLDWFDRLERRYAIDRDFSDMLPSRWISWGVVGERDGWARYYAYRYFLIRLPSYGVGYNVQMDDECAWGQRVLMYKTGYGWQVFLDFDPVHIRE